MKTDRLSLKRQRTEQSIIACAVDCVAPLRYARNDVSCLPVLRKSSFPKQFLNLNPTSLRGSSRPKQSHNSHLTSLRGSWRPKQSYLRIFALLFLCFFLLFTPVKAQLSTWDIGGYVKNMVSYGNINDLFSNLHPDFGRFQNTSQGRFNINWYPVDDFYLSLQSRHLLIYQENIQLLNSFSEIFSKNNYYFNLKYEYLDHRNAYAYSEIDRFYTDWTLDALQVTLGRQRIAWGTCLVWNPTDLFNPFNFLDFDYEERPGSDALLLQYYTGPVSQFALAVSPGRTKREVVYALRYQTNFSNYDMSILAGWQKETMRLGFTWAGQLGDAGFRGEILYSDPHIEYIGLNPYIPPFYFQKIVDLPYWTGVFSLDYTFSNSLYLHTEYLYNGLGTKENAAWRQWDIIYTGELTPARQSIFFEMAYNITPLARGDVFIIFNPNDISGILSPSLQYSLATNWDMFLLAFFTFGDSWTEFGDFPNQYFLRFKFSF